MKTPISHSRSRGFTLVELLVVISIIAVLGAMAFGAATLAINKAKRTKANADAMALYTAIQAYYDHYAKLPSMAQNQEQMDTGSQDGVKLLLVLLGKEDAAGEMENPSRIPFLNVTESKSRAKGGLVYGSSGSNSIQGLFDPWGNPFRIIFDNDYDDEIRDPLRNGNIIRNKRAIVYTYGGDEKPGTNDDVKTWSN